MMLKPRIKLMLMTLSAVVVCGNVFAQEEESFSGVYQGYQLIPNRMADLCKVSAQTMVENPAELADCVSRLALKRRSSDAETSREGLKELKEIEAEQLVQTLGLAVSKGAAVADYYTKGSDELSEANKNAKTVNDVDAAAIQTTAVLTSMVNGVRDLYVEQLKYLAISSIEDIDKNTLETIATTETLENAAKRDAEKQAADSSATEPESEVAEINTNVATLHEELPATQWVYKGDGVCELCVQKEGQEAECRQETCPDGQYNVPNDTNVMYDCKGGICEKIDIGAR